MPGELGMLVEYHVIDTTKMMLEGAGKLGGLRGPLIEVFAAIYRGLDPNGSVY